MGSGSTELSTPGFWTEDIGSEELKNDTKFHLEENGVRLRDAEHLVYYRVFQDVFPKVCSLLMYQLIEKMWNCWVFLRFLIQKIMVGSAER